MQRRFFLAASAAAALAAPAVFAQGGGKPTPLKFTLDFRINGQTAPFFLAMTKGYYKDEGLDVSIDTGAGSVASITRIASGVYQLAWATSARWWSSTRRTRARRWCRPCTSTTTAHRS